MNSVDDGPVKRKLNWIVSMLLVLVACVKFTATPAFAQASPPEPAHDVSDLAKQTQNPVSNLTAVPLQFNFNTGGDLEDRTLLNLNFQPVIPFRLTANWNVIARTIVPINSFPGPDGTRSSGIGDIQEQLFITPARPGGIIWGIGPMLSLPTATATAAETGTWGAGVSGVVLKMAGPWVLGGWCRRCGRSPTRRAIPRPICSRFSHSSITTSARAGPWRSRRSSPPTGMPPTAISGPCPSASASRARRCSTDVRSASAHSITTTSNGRMVLPDSSSDFSSPSCIRDEDEV